MALQIIREEDPKATDIFKLWQEVRGASWKIRELTDEKNLSINSDKVLKQIGFTRTKREQLLQACRAYFSELVEQGPAIRFIINETIKLQWPDPLIEVQVRHSKVILIEIKNQSDSTVHLIMRTHPNDELLFWNKKFVLAPNSSRFSFLVCSPLSEHQFSNQLQITDNLDRSETATVHVQGIPMTDPPYTLIPGERNSKVSLPDTNFLPATMIESFDESIKFHLTDKKNGKPLAARIEVRDDEGNAYWHPLKGPSFAIEKTVEMWKSTLWQYQPGPYFYAQNQIELGVSPKRKRVYIYHGFEYKHMSLEVPADGLIEAAMERWIDMPELGWYSGQTHIHTTDVGIPVQFSQYWPMVSQGEDLHVSAILTLKGGWETHAIYSNEYPMGKREAFSTDEHIITYGEEFRNNPYGHLAFLGLDYMVQPIGSGSLSELGGPDYPSNSLILDEALEQGGTTIAAHFGFIRPEPIKAKWPFTGFEMPVAVALGKIHLAEIYGNQGYLDIWYDILNCGFQVAATAGPDWSIKDSPRVYVYLGDQPFTLDNWRNSLQKGHSFVTRGPMLFFEVNGQKPGNQFNVKKDSIQLKIKAEALIPDGKIPVEIVYNGEVAAKGTDLNTDLILKDSGWLAARCEGAHSNPVYINFKNRQHGYAGPAEKFIQIINRLKEWVNEKGLFYEPDQKTEVQAILNQGIEIFEDIKDRAKQ
jgi:hypothetical protein